MRAIMGCKTYISSRRFLVPILSTSLAFSALPQETNRTQHYPSHLPYSFNNFVWWTNDDLRVLLKKRIPGLGDEVATTNAAEGRIRANLQELLKQRGIVAEVQSEEPSYSALGAERAPEAPPPSVIFSIASPRILVDQIVLSHAPDAVANELQNRLRMRGGHAYSSAQDWTVRSDSKEVLQSNGYLEGQVDISHDAPRADSSHYVVNLVVSVISGPQYRISSITADGGFLLQGRDLSSFFSQKPGEIAGVNPFGKLPSELHAYYAHRGYADVAVNASPDLDRANGLVSWRLSVTPGTLYHLHSLTIQGLGADQEKSVRDLLGMKPGDVYDDEAVNNLYHRIASEPLLAGYSFSFGPQRDKLTGLMELTLSFWKTGGASSVTIH